MKRNRGSGKRISKTHDCGNRTKVLFPFFIERSGNVEITNAKVILKWDNGRSVEIGTLDIESEERAQD